jgi:hypothetical protein
VHNALYVLCAVKRPLLKPYWSFLITFVSRSWKSSLFKMIFLKTLHKEFSRLIGLEYEPGERSRYGNWLRAGRPRGRSSSPGRVNNFLFSTATRPAPGPTQPPIQWVLGTHSPGVKRQGREADHSPPGSAEVKKIWIYISTPLYSFMV